MTALPPGSRSRTALRFTAAAAAGRFELQRCAACSAVQYPPREACHRCLGTRLEWTLQSGAGRLISTTVLRHSHIPYFRERLPWRIGLVGLDAGPTVLAHLHQSVPDTPCRVRVTARLDRAGQGVLVAMNPTESIEMNDDVKLREMSSDPRGSRVWVAELGSPFGQSLLRELKSAGAAEVLSGQLGDGQGAAGQSPASLDIVINNPGAGGTDASAREQMDVNYFGLIRRWEELGPALRAPRGGWPGTRAWVNILALDALCNVPSQSTYSASMAAAHSFSQGMRAQARSAGLRIVNVFPAAPMTAENRARAVVRALIDGLEDVYPGEVAQEFLARWLQSPKALEQEVGGHV